MDKKEFSKHVDKILADTKDMKEVPNHEKLVEFVKKEKENISEDELKVMTDAEKVYDWFEVQFGKVYSSIPFQQILEECM